MSEKLESKKDKQRTLPRHFFVAAGMTLGVLGGGGLAWLAHNQNAHITSTDNEQTRLTLHSDERCQAAARDFPTGRDTKPSSALLTDCGITVDSSFGANIVDGTLTFPSPSQLHTEIVSEQQALARSSNFTTSDDTEYAISVVGGAFIGFIFGAFGDTAVSQSRRQREADSVRWPTVISDLQ